MAANGECNGEGSSFSYCLYEEERLFELGRIFYGGCFSLCSEK